MAIDEEKNTSCKKTPESPSCSSSLIDQNFFFGQSEAVKSKCLGALLDLTVNFHHEHSIVPINCPWVPEDESKLNSTLNKLT